MSIFFLGEQVAVKKEMINKNKSFDQNSNDDDLHEYKTNENDEINNREKNFYVTIEKLDDDIDATNNRRKKTKL